MHAQPAHSCPKHPNMVNTQGMPVAVLFKNSTNKVNMAFSYFLVFRFSNIYSHLQSLGTLEILLGQKKEIKLSYQSFKKERLRG